MRAAAHHLTVESLIQCVRYLAGRHPCSRGEMTAKQNSHWSLTAGSNWGEAREADRETLREAVRDMHFRCRFSFVERKCGWGKLFQFSVGWAVGYRILFNSTAFLCD